MNVKKLLCIFLSMLICCASTVLPVASQSFVAIAEVSVSDTISSIRDIPQYIYVSMSLGASGSCVKSFQKLLIEAGYLASGQADGSYGPKTGAAVASFQDAIGLEANGVADLVTQIKLVEQLTSFEENENGVSVALVKGFEVALFPTGEIYVGTISDSGAFSEGQYYHPSKGWYVGHFKYNKRSGTGIAYFLDGDIYEGNWDKDMMNGKGTYYFLSYNNIEHYEGNWVDNEMSGKGTYIAADGKSITGTWEHNQHKGW